MKSLILSLLVLTTGLSFGKSFDKVPVTYKLPIGISPSDYVQGMVVLKEKEEYRDILSGNSYNGQDYLNQILVNIGASNIHKEYPNHKALLRKYDSQGNTKVDLSLILKMNFDQSNEIEAVINRLLSTGFFEYVEPIFLHKPLYTPNDTLISEQYYLDLVKAYEGWDVSQGDTNVVIAITDTGVEIDHDDIKNQYKYNYADPINGIDDDMDGYIDNFHGWDVGNNDNNPDVDAGQSRHGIWVTGIAGMQVDNTTLGAGVGFKSKILPVKIMDSGGSLANSYNGIVYAADHDADIINCSWGSANSWSHYGQDIVTYATINKGALVICAGGNSTADEQFYPASYKYAMNVALTSATDEITSISTWSYAVDVSAPGDWMPTTAHNDGWQNVGSGSSFSAPVVSGIAAILKAENPTWTPMQITGQIKNTTDYIDDVPANATYVDKLGEGRVNMYRALTESGNPYIEIDSYSFGNSAFVDNDTVYLTGVFNNYLEASSAALTATIESPSSYIELINESVNLGVISELGNTNNNSNPFSFRIVPGAPANTSVEILIRYEDGSYTSKEVLNVVINRDYIDLDVNDVLITVASNGRLGYSSPNQLDGNGISYQGSGTMLYGMHFMIAQASDKVSFARDGEFAKNDTMEVVDPGMESDRDIRTYFDDSPAGGNELSVNVKAKAFAWNKAGHENYAISEYKIINKSGGDLVDIYPALYADWDIESWNQNMVYYDSDRHMGVAYYPGGYYAGIRLLTDTNKTNFYTLNNDGSNGSISIYDGFSQTEQFNLASGGLQRTSSALGDIAELIGAGPLTVSNADSTVIAFAIVLGNDSLSVASSADSAAVQYYNIRHVEMSLSGIQNASCYGDCDGSSTVESDFGVEPYSYSWNDAAMQTSETAANLCPGQYIVTVTDAVGNTTTRNVIIGEPDSLEVSVNSVTNATCYDYCDATASITVSGGTMGYNYHWNDSTLPNSPAPMLCAGIHELTVIDANGCSDTTSFSTTQPDELIISITDTIHQTHPDTCNASAAVAVSGGNAPYSYSWDDDASSMTNSVDSLCADDYTVTVIDASGCISSTDVEIELDYVDLTSTDNLVQDESLMVYPNPSSGMVNINSDKNIIKYDLYSTSGQLIKSENLNSKTLNISNLSAGIYQVVIHFENGIVTKRLEVIK